MKGCCKGKFDVKEQWREFVIHWKEYLVSSSVEHRSSSGGGLGTLRAGVRIVGPTGRWYRSLEHQGETRGGQRWSDDITAVVEKNWVRSAQNREAWKIRRESNGWNTKLRNLSPLSIGKNYFNNLSEDIKSLDVDSFKKHIKREMIELALYNLNEVLVKFKAAD